MPSPYNRFNKRPGSYNDHRNGGRQQGGTYRKNHYGQQTEYVGMREMREAKEEGKEERKERRTETEKLEER